MSDERSPEPLVVVDREAFAPSLPGGGRPGLLLVEASRGADPLLTPPLVAAGFDVLRTARPESARDLVWNRSSIVMALVRTDAPGLPAASLVRELRALSPGLWIGLLGDDRGAEEGYAAGADDLVPASAPASATADRLARSVPAVLRKRERILRRAVRKPRSRLRRLLGHGRTRWMAAAYCAGALAALLTRSWLLDEERRDRVLERIATALEEPRERPAARDGAFERRARLEELDLRRQELRDAAIFHRERLEESRLDHILERSRTSLSAP